MMLPAATAARRQRRIGIAGQGWSEQREAEYRSQYRCNDAAHFV